MYKSKVQLRIALQFCCVAIIYNASFVNQCKLQKYAIMLACFDIFISYSDGEFSGKSVFDFKKE